MDTTTRERFQRIRANLEVLRLDEPYRLGNCAGCGIYQEMVGSYCTPCRHKSMKLDLEALDRYMEALYEYQQAVLSIDPKNPFEE